MSYGSKRRVAKAILTLVSVAGVGFVLVPAAVVATAIDYAGDREPGGLVSPLAWLLVVLGAARAAGHVPKVSGRKLPGSFRVRWSIATVARAGLAALCSLPGGPLWPALAAVVAALVARGMWRATLSTYGFVSWAEQLRTGAALAWRRTRVLTLAALASALVIGTLLATSGVWLAGALAAALALAPARLHMRRAAAIEAVRTEVEAALAGLLTGSKEWGPDQAAVGWSPVSVDVDPDLMVQGVAVPLPPTWQGSRAPQLEEEIGRRLAPWSEQGWRVQWKHDERWAVVRPRPPVPSVAWADWPAAQEPIPDRYPEEEYA